MSAVTRALIDTGALAHNLAQVRMLAPGCSVMAVIKADGYGHGLLRVAEALSEANAFAVARVEEGLRLREAGIQKRIIVLSGCLTDADLDAACRRNLEPVVHHAEQIERLMRFSPSSPLALWLKVDSGMHRLGVAPAAAREAWQRLKEWPGSEQLPGLMTHLASADELESSQTDRQLDAFFQVAEGLDAELSIANSAGIVAWERARRGWLRPGIMLYGISPMVDATGEHHGLRPAMTLVTRLIAVNRIPKGEQVGYGATWTCPEDMPVGVAAVGYGDGYPRHAPLGTPVLVNGRRVPLIGRVSMDLITVDLRTQPDAAPGDPVVCWGRGLPVEEVARCAGTIGYELVCKVTQRVEVTAVGEA